jgi:tetratricopeptide (TPR) repeat protein/predicted Ser/Thr protein kinase
MPTSMADSERIGPYRVIRRLGAGGMGEVVLAHDDRLDRLVAIKRLHDRHASTSDRRERFRREAKIAARLNHPAIVQIHDVIQQGAYDYLIMEYVEGRTLREHCNAGPMPLSEMIGIAHQIAHGMAAAHDLGIIHRDLKPENILLTPAGRAKITDFGIAKLRGENTITAKGAVVGTFRAMSPEQALGHAVDHRSDLFSFGILLYAALSGVSPFHADTPFLTVHRLVHEDPRPISELVPSITGDLASLVHQLLAKEPLLRPRDFHEVAGALIELAGEACPGGSSPGGLASPGEDTQSTGDRADIVELGAPARPRVAPRRRLWYAATGLAVLGALGIGYAVRDPGSSAASPGAPLRVAVLPPDHADATDRPDIALLASRVRNAVMAGVRVRAGLDLVPQSDIDDYVEGVAQDRHRRPTQREIQTAVGADEVIATHIECASSSCRITLDRDAHASGSPAPESFQLAADSAGHPGDTVNVHLNKLYPDHPLRDAAGAGSIDPADYDRYKRLVEEYWAGPATRSIDELLAEIEHMRARSPRSLDVLLFEAEIRRHLYDQTTDFDQARRAMDLLRNADQLFPDTYGILSARFDIALAADQIDDARVLLDRLVVLDPDSSTTHLQRAKLHWRRRELARARDELADAARRDSFSWRVLYYQARVSQLLGDPAATRAAIDQLLKRSPGNYAGLALLAGMELHTGRLACAERRYAQLVARKPLYYECADLGYTREQLGRYREAADSYRCALAIRPTDLMVLFDLGESLLLAGDTSGSSEQLRAAYEILSRKRRLSPTGRLGAEDLVMEPQILAYLGRDDPALAVQARARAAELVTLDARPKALNAAALVYAVLGDRELAARYVTKYLDGGGSPAELGYPWFDDLRRDPVLGPRLTVPPVAGSCEGPAP